MDVINDFLNKITIMYDPILLTVFYEYLLFVVLVFLLSFIQILLFFDRAKKQTDILDSKLETKYFIQFIDNALRRRISKRLRVLLLMDKALILSVEGDFDEALLIMNNIKKFVDKNKSINLKVLFYNNYLDYLLDSGRIIEAKKFYNSNKYYFSKKTKNIRINKSLDGTMARYNIEFGNIAKSKEKLLELLKDSQTLRDKVFREYYIGLADLKLGNKSEAESRFKRIYPSTKNIFIGKKIKELMGWEFIR